MLRDTQGSEAGRRGKAIVSTDIVLSVPKSDISSQSCEK